MEQKRLYLICGPRGSGRTTFLNEMKSDAVFTIDQDSNTPEYIEYRKAIVNAMKEGHPRIACTISVCDSVLMQHLTTIAQILSYSVERKLPPHGVLFYPNWLSVEEQFNLLVERHPAYKGYIEADCQRLNPQYPYNLWSVRREMNQIEQFSRDTGVPFEKLDVNLINHYISLRSRLQSIRGPVTDTTTITV